MWTREVIFCIREVRDRGDAKLVLKHGGKPAHLRRRMTARDNRDSESGLACRQLLGSDAETCAPASFTGLPKEGGAPRALARSLF